MDVVSTRHANLQTLLDEAGSVKALGKMVGIKPNYLTQVGTTSGKARPMGHEVARKLETGMGKPHGWMDVDHSDANTGEIGSGRVARVPLLTWALAGLEMDSSDEPVEHAMVYTAAGVSEAAFALRVRGDSMVDIAGGVSFPDGSVIVVDPAILARPGDQVVVRLSTSEEAVFKQLEFDGELRFLKPLNARYPITSLPVDARILGVVVQVQIDTRQTERLRAV